jgi:histidinol phosphatase-like enzyme (inositol monophosphatase family)
MSGHDDVLDLRAFADELADAARAAILPHFRASHAIEDKGAKTGRGYDPVTEADRAAEAAIRALIAKHYPTHGVLGEEFDPVESRDGHTWVIDPIDGTRAFISGLPLWGVLIGLMKDGAPVLGVIDQPYIGERFRGWLGKNERGADLVTRAGVRAIGVSACGALNEAKLATTDARLFRGAEDAAFAAVRDRARLTRYGCDCYAYAMVALGALDCVIESGLAPWDVAALAPVLEGAGGGLSDWTGAPIWRRDDFLSRDTRVRALAWGDARIRDEAAGLLAQA